MQPGVVIHKQVFQLADGCRNGKQQLIVWHLKCTDHLLGFILWWPSPPYNHEKLNSYHYWAFTVGLYLQTLIGPSVIWSRNRLLSDYWIPQQVLEFTHSRAKHHAKRNRWFQSDDMGRVISLSLTSMLLISNGSSIFLLTDLYLVTILFSGQRWVRLKSSDQAMYCHFYTLRHYMWSSGSWQIFHVVGLECVFSQADWLLNNAIPCYVQWHWKKFLFYIIPIIFHLCISDIRLRTMLTKNESIFENIGQKDPNLKRGHSECWIMYGRHGSREWYRN